MSSVEGGYDLGYESFSSGSSFPFLPHAVRNIKAIIKKMVGDERIGLPL
jgi:hypothetical protein